MIGLGEAAALATALSWSLCAQAFAAAGARIGSVAVNHVRLTFAMALLPIIHRIVLGTFVPHGISRGDVALLLVSGLVGIVLGDASGFRALVLIGAARTTLVVTLTPAFAAMLARTFLDERMSRAALLGMGVTLCGLIVGVAARFRRERGTADALPPRLLALGLVLALGGAIGQAGGQVLSKPALASVDPLSATFVRVAGAVVTFWAGTAVASLVRRGPPKWWGAWRDGQALRLTFLGTIAGPIGGIWLSQVATKHADVGVSATLMALVPLFVMAEDALFFGRRPSMPELAGAAIAVSGVVLLATGS